jgi:hypothetical protein
LLKLNSLVRQRRKQLAFLEKCPNKNCECRLVWRQVVEKNLSEQVGKIRYHVKSKPARRLKRKTARPLSRSR